MNCTTNRPRAFSLTELMAALAIIAVLATLVVYSTSAKRLASKKAACEAIQGDIELQCELWRHNTGTWPATNLSDITGNTSYFPTGVPACPYDGTAYTITTSGLVSGHNH
jgi:prepilin-type N-terminal cleavage/methylation domain-containing protein